MNDPRVDARMYNEAKLEYKSKLGKNPHMFCNTKNVSYPFQCPFFLSLFHSNRFC